MNGPEHYAEAERLRVKADADNTPGITLAEQQVLLAAAQVHAELAHTAAIIEAARARVKGHLSPGWKVTR